jgi:alkyldihydroxyacetonephosphate synthase
LRVVKVTELAGAQTKTHATLSNRPERRFWGWGYLRDGIVEDELRKVQVLLAWRGGAGPELAEPRVEDFTLPPPRIAAPATLAAFLSSSPYDRLTHCCGKSFPDGARLWMREATHVPDWVAFPRNEAEIIEVLDWASRNNIAVVPYGGGTSVVGGVEPIVGSDYAASVSLDMERFDRVLEVDRTSRAARIQSGVLGPGLENQLRVHQLTLRHFPQSFQFSTLGGWIATRAGGHYATLYTHIDDFVESVRLVAPAGVIETRRLPASGAGPAPDRLVIGSEGTLGIITEAWVRLQDRPRFRASASVQFNDMSTAVRGVRALSQSGLFPSNCRLLDPAEVAFAGVGDRRSPTLVLGFESADHGVRPWMARALELVADHGGRWDAEAVERSMRDGDEEDGGEHRKGAAGAWRDAFLRMPYLRDEATRRGAILDTFESAITWDRFEAFYTGVLDDVGEAIARITGREAPLSCRFTHVYPDGPAPYFTYAAIGATDGDLRSAIAKWREIKLACNAAVVTHGGTSTHHHAVGRDHRSAYEVEVPALMRAALAGAKKVLDPKGVMNPGVLIDIDRGVRPELLGSQ